MAYASRISGAGRPAGVEQPVNPSLLATAFHKNLSAALRIPAMEAQFPEPWTVAARRVLPSSSPQFAAAAMWGPVFGWCVLDLLAKSIDAEKPESAALDLFDRLRLREPLAQAFAALGFEDEESWRAAARIKVLLLSRAGIGKATGEVKELVAEGASSAVLAEAEVVKGSRTRKQTAIKPAADKQIAVDEKRWTLAPELWLDADVRWLTGAHQAQGQSYLVREPYEELLWWLQLPSILRLAGGPAANRAAAKEMSKTVEEELDKAEVAGYRIDALQEPSTGMELAVTQEAVVEIKAAKQIKPRATP